MLAPLWVIAMVVAILLGILVFGIALFMVIRYFMTQSSGWPVLTERYPAPAEPGGELMNVQTIKLNQVRWRFSTTLGIWPQGLYIRREWTLRTLTPGRLPNAILIPWPEFRSARHGHIYLGWQAVELWVGEPAVVRLTVTRRVYEAMWPYLPPECRQSASG